MSTNLHAVLLVAASALALLPPSVRAQSVMLLEPGPPSGEVGRGFTDVRSIRELSDGRTLVADGGEMALYLVDWNAGTVEQVGRSGMGPGEYMVPRYLYPLAGDSTFLLDGARRGYVLDGIRFVDTFTEASELIRSFGFPEGATRDGSLVRTVGLSWSPDAPYRSDDVADSLGVLLARSALEHGIDQTGIDTIARLRGGGAGGGGCAMAAGGSAIDQAASLACRTFLVVRDEVAVLPDGTVAIARADPYRIELVEPDGTVTRGPVTDHPMIEMNTRERCAVRARWEADRMGDCGRSDVADLLFPDRLPPFTRDDYRINAGGVPNPLPTRDGHILVRLSPSADHLADARYDVFDRSGTRIGRIALPDRAAIVGFGEGTVYTIRTDDFDLQWLRRHPWSSGG